MTAFERGPVDMASALPSTDAFAPGPAPPAGPDVGAVLSALRDLSTLGEAGAAAPPPPRGQRYTRVRLHARGGLGQVWLGRDELVGRDVAIKEPRDDRPGEAAQAALEREAWVLGRLQHPNIVPLYDLVRDPDGRARFYVMPFLGGDGLHDLTVRFHAARPPGPATRLALLPLLTAFLDTCAAIDHAHSRGIWHLDIKGANVKLGPAGAAVVLDWGLSRLAAPAAPAAGELPPGTAGATGAGSAAAGVAGGTPAFMAPEQAEAPAARVGPHTDVYGLGALLYLLLTGRPPHADAAGRTREDLARLLNRPVAPPRALWPGVPAALEAVCLKALAVEPADRYDSPAGLADDVRRWLADEAVAACSEPLPARLARWGRRHSGLMTGAGAIQVTAAVALAVGLAVVNHERRVTEQHRQAAETALARERDSFRQALKAGNDYFTAVSDSPLLQGPGQQPLRRQLLQYGLAYYQDFLDRRGGEPALRAEVAAAWFRVGQIHAAVGTLADAVAAYDQAVALGEERLAGSPADAELQEHLAQWHVAAATAARRAGRFTDALGHVDRAAVLAGAWPGGDPHRAGLAAQVLAVRGAVLDQAGDAARACAACEQAEALFARAAVDPRTCSRRATNLIRLGQLRRDGRRLAEAAEAVGQARDLFRGLLGEPALALTAQWRLADCEHTLGLIAAASGDTVRAWAHFEAAHAARRRLVAENPTVHTHRAELIATCLNLARHYRGLGHGWRAGEYVGEAAEQAEELMREDPTDVYYRGLAVRVFRLAAGEAEARADACAATALRDRSEALLAGFGGAPLDCAAWQSLACDAGTDGRRQLAWGQWRAARASLHQALACQHQARQLAASPVPALALPADQRARASRQ